LGSVAEYDLNALFCRLKAENAPVERDSLGHVVVRTLRGQVATNEPFALSPRRTFLLTARGATIGTRIRCVGTAGALKDLATVFALNEFLLMSGRTCEPVAI
jgi:hypothetical protein